MGDHVVEQPQRVVAGDAEDVVDVELGEAIEKVVGDGGDRGLPGVVGQSVVSSAARIRVSISSMCSGLVAKFSRTCPAPSGP
jgi:hypothetical protein